MSRFGGAVITGLGPFYGNGTKHVGVEDGCLGVRKDVGLTGVRQRKRGSPHESETIRTVNSTPYTLLPEKEVLTSFQVKTSFQGVGCRVYLANRV
jgi:hypothetical protein